MELDRETFEQTMRAMTEHLERQERLIQVLVDDLKTRHSQGKLYIHGERMYDSKELVQMLLMGERTLQRYRTSGELPYIKLHRHAYYRESDVVRLINEKGKYFNRKATGEFLAQINNPIH
jgi:hypothetical protein